MTNKVKPFFIRITDDMTPQMVQEALEKCVTAGAKRCDNTSNKPIAEWPHFGVCGYDGTYLSTSVDGYHCDEEGNEPQEITLEQLDGWLGIKSETGLEYGKVVEWSGVSFIYIAQHPVKPERSVCVHSDHGSAYSILTSELSKPETPEQRAERERLESAYDLYCNECAHKGCVPYNMLEIELSFYLRIVDKTGYRKQ